MSLATFGARGRSKPPTRQFPRWAKVLVGALVFAVVFALFAVRYLEVYRLNREAVRLAGIKRSLQQHNAVFREEIKLLHTPEYIERVAREQLGLVRPGEIAVLIVRPPAPPPAQAVLKQDRRSFLSRVVQAVERVLSR